MDSDDDDSETVQISYLNRSPECCLPLPQLEPKENHSIMFSHHIQPGIAPCPYPPSYSDKWDSDHVRMSCSPKSNFPVQFTEVEVATSRWNLICESLRKDIGSSKELEMAMMTYISQYFDMCNFEGLHAFFNMHCSEAEREQFFKTVLPAMIQIALDLPNLCTQPIPVLKKGKDHYVTMTQKQIGCLLLNAFFCTFPRNDWEYATYPEINFYRLFFGTENMIHPVNAEKLKCLINYFRRITTQEPCGTVTFHRQCLLDSDLPSWSASTCDIRTAVIKSSGLIETEGHGMLQVDFANKFVGGGVLHQGCVQEEIRFAICPELIVSRLFVESLGPNEVLIVEGVEQYNKYTGYAFDFKWGGDFVDETPRDSWGRRCTQLVAMDATYFSDTNDQYRSEFIKKELDKAFCGFYQNGLPLNLPAVATGNWGCGAFRGCPRLKFLIQLMAASEAGRSILYFTFGTKNLRKELRTMYQFLTNQKLSVGDIWKLLIKFSDHIHKKKYSDLYKFIYDQFLTKRENSEETKTDESLDDSDKKTIKKFTRCCLQ